MPDWTQWRLLTARDNADACAQILLDAGCDGVQIEDCTVQFDQSEDATLVARDEATVTAYMAPGFDAARFRTELEAALTRDAIAARIEAAALSDQDWAVSWRENFPPLHIGAFLIVPSWLEAEAGAPPSDAVVIRLDPGLAFGTGQHPTTRMCLELLPAHFPAPAGRVLDVGCGSGILSIAAAKLGAQVTGSDLDAWCVQATRENSLANNVTVAVVQAAGLDWAASVFDLVVANMMSALLITLAPDLHRVVRPGGHLIISGISEARADDVQAAFARAGFQTVEKRLQDGEQRGDFIERWAAFALKR